MAKEDVLLVQGVIIEILPERRFRVHLGNGHAIIA
jgi:translation initiation factor IF-1